MNKHESEHMRMVEAGLLGTHDLWTREEKIAVLKIRLSRAHIAFAENPHGDAWTNLMETMAAYQWVVKNVREEKAEP